MKNATRVRGPLHTRTPFYLAALLLILSLLLSLTSGYVLYQSFREAKTREIGRNLLVRAELAVDLLAQAAEYTMLYLMDDTLNAVPPDTEEAWGAFFEQMGEDLREQEAIREQLAFVRERSEADAVVLLSNQQRVIADVESERTPGAAAEIPPEDTEAWNHARNGEAASVLVNRDGQPAVRVYAPVRLLGPEEYFGRVGAVLRMESSAGFEQLRDLQRTGMAVAAAMTLLAAGLAFLFWRLMRRFALLTASAAHQDRLQAMGTLTAGIAHEIRNPLGIIRAFAEGLRRRFTDEHSEREICDDIIGEVERLNTLVNRYLEFARPDAVRGDEAARPDEMLPEIAHLIEKGDAGAAVEVFLDEGVAAVAMSPNALRQVLLNLVMNARQASSAEQSVELRCQDAHGRVVITVRDHGGGISARDLARVFEPFFTTRTDGSGLGLSICQQLVEEVDGEISMTSTPGEGTTVTVTLPRASRESSGEETP